MSVSIKKFKILVIIVSFFFASVFIIVLLLPSHVVISKTIIINAGKEKIAAQINDLNNWKNWFPLFQNKNITTDIIREGNSEYAVLTTQNQILEFVLYNKNQDTINIDTKGNYIKQTYQFTLLNKNEQTQLTWKVDFTFNEYSFKKLTSMFIYQLKSQQYEDILKNMKIQIEKIH